jgi:capsular exopolysaccharide synthesis family protein
MLRTNLQFSSVDHPLHSLLVTSSSPEEGKSFVVANIAVVMAQVGKRVVLVDADLRRPSQHLIFDLGNTVGLTTVLLDGDIHLAEVLQNTPVENLKVMTSGPIPPNPSEILGSLRMGHLIETMQEQADIIIFDSPPVTAVADATVLAARLDGTLLVIDSGRTRREMARRTKEALVAVGATVLGAVLNRLPERDSGYGYYYQEEDPQQARRSRTAFLIRRSNHTSSPAKKPPAKSERRINKGDAA